MAEAAVLEQLPAAPAREAMLTKEQACAWLQISERQLERLNLPVVRLGKRTPRYHVGSIIDHLTRWARK